MSLFPLKLSAALYCNFLRAPTLLPNKRSEEQTKAAYRMLRDCFQYVSSYQTVVMESHVYLLNVKGLKLVAFFFCRSYSLNTSICRAKVLVKYFGEDFGPDGCRMYFSTSSMTLLLIHIKDALLAISCETAFLIADIFYKCI